MKGDGSTVSRRAGLGHTLRVLSHVPHRRRCVPVSLEEDLLRDTPQGVYLLEERGGRLLLWKLSEGEPTEEAYSPLALWPLLLPD